MLENQKTAWCGEKKKTSARLLTRIESGRGRNGSVFLLSMYLQVLELTPKGMIRKKKKDLIQSQCLQGIHAFIWFFFNLFEFIILV